MPGRRGPWPSSRSGHRLASCGEDRTGADLGPEGRRHPAGSFYAHLEGVNALAVSPDGRQLVSSGRPLRSRSGIRPDCKRIHGPARIAAKTSRASHSARTASCWRWGGFDVDRSVKIRRTRTGELIASLRHPTPGTLAVAFSPDGKLLAVAAGNSAYLWDVASATLLQTFKRHDQLITDVASPAAGGEILATAGRSFGRPRSDVALGPLSRAGRLGQCGRHFVPNEASHLAFRPHTQELVVLGNTPSSGSEARVFGLPSGRRIRTRAGLSRSRVFSNDGRLVAEAIQRSADDGHVEVIGAAKLGLSRRRSPSR